MDNQDPSQNNPYAPPVASLEDERQRTDSTFNPQGNRVPAGRALEWIGSAWEGYRRAFGAWLGISALYLLLGLVVACIPVGNQVLMCLLAGGFLIGCQRFHETGSIEVGDLFAGFQTAGSGLALTGLIQAGIYYVFFLPGFILQMVATFTHADQKLIWAATGLYYVLAFLGGVVLKLTLFAPALVVFHNVEPLTAIRTSIAVCFRNFGAFLVFVILSYLLMVGGFMCCMIGLIFVMPLYVPAYYSAYRDIFLHSDTGTQAV